MQDKPRNFDPDLADLTRAGWMCRLVEIGRAHGFWRAMGKRHFALHLRRGDTLLVCFETVQEIRNRTETCSPIGWHLAGQSNWSHLSMISDGDTWFRDDAVYAAMDDLIDDGFFDAFDKVIFYGAGPCGYAAAAYSVAAPGAHVLALQPQATLDPAVASWDKRYANQRRLDFRDRYGYAPHMLDACAEAFILYDPLQEYDAMHAALFKQPGVTTLRLPHMGDALERDLLAMNLLAPLLRKAANGTLDQLTFAKLYRARRTHPPYLRRLMANLDAEGHDHLVQILARNVSHRLKLPRFERRLKRTANPVKG